MRISGIAEEATLSESPVYGQILSKLAFAKYGIKKAQLQEDIGASKGTYGSGFIFQHN